MKIENIAKTNKDYGIGNVASAIIFIWFCYFAYNLTETNKKSAETIAKFADVFEKVDKRLSRIEGYMFVKEVKTGNGETFYEIVPLGE